MAFPYSSDIGTNSIPALTALANSSGITLAVVSSYRPGDRGLHGSQNAVDFAGSADAMRQVAAYLYQYSPYLLELIHTNYTVEGGGYYVKNGEKVPQSRYDGPDITTGGNIIKGHVNHIHLAATMSGLRAASADVEKLAGKDVKLWDLIAKDKPETAGSSNILTIGGRRLGGCLPTVAASITSIGILVSSIADIF